MSKQEFDPNPFYELDLTFKLSPKKWNVIPNINRYMMPICLFRFEWLFICVELQKWEDINFGAISKKKG